MNYTPITLIGFGVAGQLLLSHILDSLPAYKIAIVDPDFIGGDLARDYRSINTNTTIQQIINSLVPDGKWADTVTALKARGNLDDCISIASLAEDIRQTGHKMAASCNQIYDEVLNATWDEPSKLWTLTFKSKRPKHSTSVICMCSGMLPRQEDYGIPIIPLRIALDPYALAKIVTPGQTVTVIGSAHSATLIIKHLNSLTDVSSICLHRGKEPFRYARDGHYDGIKQESAIIADSIMKGEYSRLSLVHMSDIRGLSSAFRKSNWIIQATGFDSRSIQFTDSLKAEIRPTWDPATGLATELPQLQAFGACVPNVSIVDGKKFPDISVGSFIDQLVIRWPFLETMLSVRKI